MQTLKDTIVKSNRIQFGPMDLTLPWCARDLYMALCTKIKDTNSGFDQRSIEDIIQTHLNLGSGQGVSMFYLPERNLLIHANNKAGSSSLQDMLEKLEKDTGEKYQNDLNPYKLLDLIEEKNPEIWYIYRDPFMRMVSYFYYIGRQNFMNSGVRWSWEGLDMYHGRDHHRRIQLALIPGYYKGENAGESLKEHLLKNADIDVSFTHDPPTDKWAYPCLENFVPHKNVKFFWMHEKEVKNRPNVMKLLYNKLNITPPMSLDEKRRYISNQNSLRPGLDEIPLDVRKKMWQAQQPERDFLSRLRWENGPIQFYGLS